MGGEEEVRQGACSEQIWREQGGHDDTRVGWFEVRRESLENAS